MTIDDVNTGITVAPPQRPSDEPDTQAPVVRTATLSGDRLVLSYTADASALRLGLATPGDAFTVLVGETPNPVTRTAVGPDNTVILALTNPVPAGQTATVAYTVPTGDNANRGVQDLAGHFSPGFAAMSVTSITTDTTPPADTTHPTATVRIERAIVNAETLITITFTEPVSGLTADAIHVENGSLGRLGRDPEQKIWGVSFTPTAGVSDDSNTVTVDLTGVRDAAGNAGVGTASATFRVDTRPPTATVTIAGHAITGGESTTVTSASIVTIVFDETVTDFTTTAITAPNGTLSALGATPGTDNKIWTLTFTPRGNVNIPGNTFSVDLTRVHDAAGNPGVGTATATYSVDARPVVTIPNNALTTVETTVVTFIFNEAVPDLTADAFDVPNATLTNFISVADHMVWAAALKPIANVSAPINTIKVKLADVRDAAGNLGVGVAESPPYSVETGGATGTATPPADTHTVTTPPPTTTTPPADTHPVATPPPATTTPPADTHPVTTPPPATTTPPADTHPVTTPPPTTTTPPADTHPVTTPPPATTTPPADTHPVATPPPATTTPPAGTHPGGDGIDGNTQVSVKSISAVLSPTVSSAPADTPTTFITLIGGSQDGKPDPDSASIGSLAQKDTPVGLPQGMEMPIGLLRFAVTLNPDNHSQGSDLSLYVDPALGVNGSWVQDKTSGVWVNLASEPYDGKMLQEGSRLRLDLHVVDGGPFDADHMANGVITIPGALAHMPLSIVGQLPDVGHDGFWF